MQIWMLTVGIGLIGLAMYDAITTTLAASTAAGPVTSRVGGGIWRLARRLARDPRSPALNAAGPLILLATIAVWMGLLWTGWSFVFSAEPAAVVSTATNEPASIWDRVYFTGYTLFTLGNGDFQPASAGWQVATSLATANGLGTATLAVTYVIPVMTAVVERRQQAATISGIGTTAQGLLINVWDGTSLRFVEQPLLRFAEEINRTAQRHLAYPILHFFHSTDRVDEFAVSIAALDEALTITTLAVAEDARPHPAAISATREAIGHLLTIIQESFHGASEQVPPPPALEPLRAAGIPLDVDDRRFHDQLRALDDRRRMLRGFGVSAGWRWDDGVEVAADGWATAKVHP